MIDEHIEELVSLYVLGLLDPEEASRLEQAMERDANLRQLADRLRESSCSLTYTLAPIEPPAGVKSRLLAEIQGNKMLEISPRRASWLPIAIPWALAAGLAIFACILFNDRQNLKKENQALLDQSSVSQMQIATLTSMMKGSPTGVAAVAWDAQKQQGVLKVSNMPEAGEDQDYQLWVVDPDYKNPVNGGVFHLAKGETTVQFTPDQPVKKADKFAISLERKGGVPVAKGPIVMLGQ